MLLMTLYVCLGTIEASLKAEMLREETSKASSVYQL
jgi:hypothetical protein